MLGVSLDSGLNFQDHATNATSKVKGVMKIIGNLGVVSKGISCKTMRQLYVSYVQPVFVYTGLVWSIKSTALRKVLGALRSASIKAMQRDAEILTVNIRMEEIKYWSKRPT